MQWSERVEELVARLCVVIKMNGYGVCRMLSCWKHAERNKENYMNGIFHV